MVLNYGLLIDFIHQTKHALWLYQALKLSDRTYGINVGIVTGISMQVLRDCLT